MRAWLIAAGFWIFVTALYTAQIVWMARQPGESINLPTILAWNTTYYLTWIPLTLLVWRTARGWVPGSMRVGPLLLRHFALASGVITLHGIVNVLIVGGLFFPQYLTSTMMAGQLRGRFVAGMLIYVAIAGAGMASDYYGRWKERELASAQLESQLSEARLQSLKAQLHPHFLFNSLHAIASLSDLLRRVLDAGARPEVTLAEEAAFLQQYFEIQRVRFGDRLSATISLEPGTESRTVPTLLLQPLVENAFRHGLADRVGGGSVALRASREPGGRLRLTVEDDGAGLPEGWTLASADGVGLRMTAARLQQRYGDDHTFAVEPRPGGGTTASIVLPV